MGWFSRNPGTVIRAPGSYDKYGNPRSDGEMRAPGDNTPLTKSEINGIFKYYMRNPKHPMDDGFRERHPGVVSAILSLSRKKG